MKGSVIDRLQTGWITRSAAETTALGADLAREVPPNTWITLEGNLGAGKTTFARGFAQGLGITTDVTSPTFAIFVPYDGPRCQFVHMDAYRLSGPETLDGLMLEDCLRPPFILLLEWPERVAAALPPDIWRLIIESPGESERRLTLTLPPAQSATRANSSCHHA